jgi:hypothetical protein
MTEALSEPTTSDAPPADETPTDQPPRAPRWRRILTATLVVLACVLAPLSAIAVWVNHTLLDTDQYVATIGPLASDPAIQNATADRITTALVSNTDLQTRVKNALPSRAAFVAPYLTSGLESFVHQASLKILESDQWATIWNQANRRVHSQLVSILKGEGTKTVSTKNGKVTLDLTPLAQRVTQRLDKLGVDAATLRSKTGITPPKQIVIIDSDSLSKAQGLVKALDSLAIVLPVLFILALAGALLLSARRRRTLLRASLGIAFAMAAVLVVFALARKAYLDALPATVHQDAAAAVYDQLLNFLLTTLRVVFAVALVVAIGAWVVGPGRYATSIREGVLGLVRRGDGPHGAIPTFVGAHLSGLRVVVIAAGFILLVALDHPGVWAVIVIALVVVLLLLLLELIGGRRRTTVPAE